MKVKDERSGSVVYTLDALKKDFYQLVLQADGTFSYLFEHVEDRAYRYGKSYVFHVKLDEKIQVIENNLGIIYCDSYQPRNEIINHLLGIMEKEIINNHKKNYK